MAHELAWKKRNRERRTQKRRSLVSHIEIANPLVSNTIKCSTCPLQNLLNHNTSSHERILDIKVLKMK